MAYHEDRFGLGHSSAIRSPLIGSGSIRHGAGMRGTAPVGTKRCSITLFKIVQIRSDVGPAAAIPANLAPGGVAVPARPAAPGEVKLEVIGTYHGEGSTEAAAASDAKSKVPVAQIPNSSGSVYTFWARTGRKTVDQYGAYLYNGEKRLGGGNIPRTTSGLFCVLDSTSADLSAGRLGRVIADYVRVLPEFSVNWSGSGWSYPSKAVANQIALSYLNKQLGALAAAELVWANDVTPASPAETATLPDWLNPFSPNFGNPNAGRGGGGGTSTGGGGGTSTGGGGGTSTGGGSGSGDGGGSGVVIGLLGAGALAYLLTKG